MRGTSRGGLLAAAIALSLGAGMAPGGLGNGMPSATVQAPVRRRSERRVRDAGDLFPALRSYPRNSGWTNARYQRAARKRRNQIRNRRAHRG